jgi:hypothetical protein
MRRNGLDDKSLGMLEAVACSYPKAAATLGCSQRQITLDDIKHDALRVAPEGSPERTLLESVFEGKLPNGVPIPGLRDDIVGKTKEAMKGAVDAIVGTIAQGKLPTTKEGSVPIDVEIGGAALLALSR